MTIKHYIKNRKRGLEFMRSTNVRLKAIFLVTTLALILSGCGKENLSALIPKGYSADSSYYLIVLTTVVMTFVFLAVMTIYTVVLIRFRRKKGDRKSTRLNSSHVAISYAVFCLKKKR